MPKSGAHQPLVRHDTDDGAETGQSVKSLADVSEEEIDSRMSRRSSVIVRFYLFKILNVHHSGISEQMYWKVFFPENN